MDSVSCQEDPFMGLKNPQWRIVISGINFPDGHSRCWGPYSLASRPGGDEGPGKEDALGGGAGQEGVPFSEGVLVPLILRWQPGGGERPGVTASFTVRGVWVSLSLLSEPCWRPLTTPYPPQGLPDTSHFPVASPAGGL